MKTIVLLFASLAIASPTFAHPDHIVLGYVARWRDAYSSPADFNYDAFTHLARAFIRENGDGTLDIADNYFNEAFENAARSHGVKLLVSIGGASNLPENWLAMARDPKHVQTFLNSLAKILDEHHYDGVDIDWEPPPKTDADGRVYADLLQAIHQRFPNKLLTLALGVTKKSLAHLPMDEVVNNVDYLNVMAYTYSTVSTGIATLTENLHANTVGPVRTRNSVDEGMHNLLQEFHVPPAKILLGINFWSTRFRVDRLGETFPSRNRAFVDNLTYPQVQDLLHTGRYNNETDSVAGSSYLVRKAGGSVVVYEDPIDVRAKCETAKHFDCAGVMIWHIGSDTGSGESPLLSAIDESFGMAKLPLSQPALEREIALLSKHPAPPNSTSESLLKIDADLRAARGIADDDKWAAGAAAAMKSATTQPKAKAINP